MIRSLFCAAIVLLPLASEAQHLLRAQRVENSETPADGDGVEEAGNEQFSELQQGRRRPGGRAIPDFPPFVYESVPNINSTASHFVPVPDRWRQFYVGKWYDPYHQNILKGDVPVFGEPGHEWFVELGVISDTLAERFKIPVPVGVPTTKNPGTVDTFGNGNFSLFVERVIPSFSLIRGNTVFKPPEFEFRATPVFSFTSVDASETGIVRVDPSRGTSRSEGDWSFLELFADVHLADISERYDFISSRFGVQEFSSDFRGFVYTDQQPGIRLFGNWDNNKWQYNFAWFPRLKKETNTFVNDTASRHEDVFIWNVYRQDLIALGHQVQGTVIYREDNAGDKGPYFNDNGLLVRPTSIGDERAKNIRSTYFGLNGDGHIGRVNTTTSFYYVTGTETHNPIAGRQQNISAFMFAQELSYDFDWLRVRGSVFWSSGDDDPKDGTAKGFDAINDVPNFAGGDLSYWQRQGIPLVAGGETFLVNLGSLIPNLRPTKEEGQSNFVNPGIRLLNVGVDVELTQELKLITNASYLQFDETETLETVRQLGEIGYDLSTGLIYRPWLNNNVEFRLGGNALLPGDGLEQLYGDKTLYSFFTNMILEY
ncbi:MAG: hypothetical protein KDD70_14905 [Bdellovibrionales bacterium]|nr:hypothetical protein [Bdellovibrionales bacterium]